MNTWKEIGEGLNLSSPRKDLCYTKYRIWEYIAHISRQILKFNKTKAALTILEINNEWLVGQCRITLKTQDCCQKKSVVSKMREIESCLMAHIFPHTLPLGFYFKKARAKSASPRHKLVFPFALVSHLAAGSHVIKYPFSLSEPRHKWDWKPFIGTWWIRNHQRQITRSKPSQEQQLQNEICAVHLQMTYWLHLARCKGPFLTNAASLFPSVNVFNWNSNSERPQWICQVHV